MNNINDNEKSAMTQCKMIRAWLENGHTITSLEALQRFGCMRLASRIHDLRKQGMDIKALRIVTPSKKWVTQYSIV